MNSRKNITLHPNWKSSFWGYLFGILLVPLFGIGLLILWFVHRKRKSVVYRFHDQKIEARFGKEKKKLDLVDIDDVKVSQNRIENWFGIGTVRLEANLSSIQLFGLEDPETIADTIRKAVAAAKEALNEVERSVNPEPEHDPGTLDKIDYLTGLWHQGLISDEEFKKEKKYFER